jgi:hypothetical protein
VTFLSPFDENVTLAARIESAIRISNMLLRLGSSSLSPNGLSIFGRSHLESNPLRAALHRVHLRSLAAPHDLETSAVLETRADVQIGGGVRVGDAFQAIVGPRPMAMWVTGSCV